MWFYGTTAAVIENDLTAEIAAKRAKTLSQKWSARTLILSQCPTGVLKEGYLIAESFPDQ